jgi:hypothetical protein
MFKAAAPELAADAHRCIMVRILTDPPDTRLWRDDVRQMLSSL